MIVIYVGGDIERALQELKKRIAADGIVRELKVRGYSKPSERRKAKASMAIRRRARGEARRRMGETIDHKGRPRWV